jgi:hypothetical protein
MVNLKNKTICRKISYVVIISGFVFDLTKSIVIDSKIQIKSIPVNAEEDRTTDMVFAR